MSTLINTGNAAVPAKHTTISGIPLNEVYTILPGFDPVPILRVSAARQEGLPELQQVILGFETPSESFRPAIHPMNHPGRDRRR